MKWIRSFPQTIPAGRAYVVDDLPRLLLTDYDYTPLGALDDDICLIEWDMAISREMREDFALYARGAGEKPLVAPYRLYEAREQPVYAHRLLSASGEESWVANERDCYADYIGLGLVYLPRTLIRGFLAAPAPARGRSPFLPSEAGYNDLRFTDQTLSIWLRHTQGRRTRIAWDVRPIHLHY